LQIQIINNSELYNQNNNQVSLETLSKNVSYLVNTSIATAKIHSLIAQEKNRQYKMRSSLHLLLGAPIGQLKSTILDEVSKITGMKVLTEITRAGMVGTFDGKAKHFMMGAAWECRNNLMLIDELDLGKKNKEGWEMQLQLMEQQQWSKRIGVYSEPYRKRDGDLSYKINKGQIDISTRFSCIAATMKRFQRQSSQGFRAYVTRNIPYRFDVSFDVLKRISEGEKIFSYQPIEVQQEINIPLETYTAISKFVEQKLVNEISVADINQNTRKEIYLRSIGDLCRVYAVHQKIDSEMWNKIVDWKLSTQLLIGKDFKDAQERKRKQEIKEKLEKELKK
jgi:hypothetical protein